jgi:hypothetical protein
MGTRIGSAYLLAALIAAVWAPLVCGAPAATPSVPQVVLRDAPVLDALNQVGKAYGLQIIARGIPEDLRVSADIVLSGLAPEEALSVICKAAGLNPPVRFDPLNAYIISGPATATVAGSDVPILGAVALTPPLVGGAALPVSPGVAGNERMSFAGEDKLVDLEVKDAPIREVMAKLSAASGFSIDVAEPVSNQLKVTAKIYRMPIGDVLSMIVDQANLTYTVSYGVNELAKQRYDAGLANAQELESKRGKPEIHIVPKPELTVTGPGARTTVVDGQPVFFHSEFPGGSYVQVEYTPVLVCPKCKCAAKVDWRYCPHCGAKLPARGKGKERANKP